MKKWRLIKSNYLLDNKWLKVRQDEVELSNGIVIPDYFVVESHRVVMLVVEKAGKLLFVRQYKHGVGEILLEFPAGYVEPNEELVVAAARELKEETGQQASGFEYLGKLGDMVTRTNEVVHVYAARGIQNTSQKLDFSEEIELLWLPIEEVVKAIKEGRLWTSSSIAAFTLWKLRNVT